MKQAAYDVMLNGARVTTVFRNHYYDADSVRRHLVNREMYDPDITVVRVG
jgi:hypothetical protein